MSPERTTKLTLYYRAFITVLISVGVNYVIKSYVLISDMYYRSNQNTTDIGKHEVRIDRAENNIIYLQKDVSFIQGKTH